MDAVWNALKPFGPWLEKQGVSTVLLVMLALGIWVRLPQLVEYVEQRHSEQIKTITDAFREDQERDAQLLQLLLQQERIAGVR